jgi:predicted aldo/keto reductase-like oxidoreductase
MKTRRKEVVLATKIYPVNNLGKKATAGDMIKGCEESLKKLQTDVIDVLQLHGIEQTGISQYDEVREALAKLKKDGKIRFTGLSSHNAGAYPAVMTEAINSGLYDTILISYNYLMKDLKSVDALLKLAGEKNIGVLIMKANYWPIIQPEKVFSNDRSDRKKLEGELKGREKDFLKGKTGTIHQENIKWVLARKEVSCVLSAMNTLEVVSENSAAPKQRLAYSGKRLLENKAREVGSAVCRFCQKCMPCPGGVAIPDILRFKAYYEHYHDPENALECYRRLPLTARADQCRSCGQCEKKCPFGLKVKSQIAAARKILV